MTSVALSAVVEGLDRVGVNYFVVGSMGCCFCCSDVQWRDCVEIAATNSLDVAYLEMWADRLGVAADLADLLAQFDDTPTDNS